MSQKNVKYSSTNETEDICGINSSFSTMIINQGVAINNNISVVNNINITKVNPPAIVERVPNHWNILFKFTNFCRNIFGLNGQREVIPKDKEILQLIWKYLSHEDKMNCTLVCKRFNYIISEMNYLRINANLNAAFRYIPKLSRNYSSVRFENYKCDNLKPLMSQMLDHFQKSSMHFTLDDCQFEMTTLLEVLYKFPLLESLHLNLILKMTNDLEISWETRPKLVHLKVLTLKINDDKLKEILEMLSAALNLESISLYDVKFKIEYLKAYKSLNSLSLQKCIMEPPFYKSNLRTLDFESSVNVSSVDYKKFDCLHNLRKLILNEVNNEMLEILKSNCIQRLTDFSVVFYKYQFDPMNIFWNEFFNRDILKENIEIKAELIEQLTLQFRDNPTLYHNGQLVIEGISESVNNYGKTMEINCENKGNSLDYNKVVFSFTMRHNQAPYSSTVIEADSQVEYLKSYNNYYKKIFGVDMKLFTIVTLDYAKLMKSHYAKFK